MDKKADKKLPKSRPGAIFTFFDPRRDIQKTVPGLACDLRSAIESGVVMDTGTLGEFNGLEDVQSIGFRVNSTFDALDVQRSLIRNHNSKAAKSVQAPAPVSTPTGEE